MNETFRSLMEKKLRQDGMSEDQVKVVMDKAERHPSLKTMREIWDDSPDGYSSGVSAIANRIVNKIADVYARRENSAGTNFQEADLTGANLQGTNLTGANLQEANLTGTDLRGAHLRWESLITAKNPDKAITDKSTKIRIPAHTAKKDRRPNTHEQQLDR